MCVDPGEALFSEVGTKGEEKGAGMATHSQRYPAEGLQSVGQAQTSNLCYGTL